MAQKMHNKVYFTLVEGIVSDSKVCCLGEQDLYGDKFACTVNFVQAVDLRGLPQECFDFVFGIAEQPYTAAILKHIQRVLKPGGKLHLQIVSGENAYTSLLFSGFTSIQSKQSEFSGTKPAYSTASVSLSAKPKASNDVWKISTQDDNPFAVNDNPFDMEEENPFASFGAMEDVQMVDMDDLLANESQPVEIKDTNMDCGTGSGRRKACKGCTCGLKEQLDDENGVKPGDAPPKSACGSCHLGDAFRCASCPYLGKPAFKEGDVVKLDGFGSDGIDELS